MTRRRQRLTAALVLLSGFVAGCAQDGPTAPAAPVITVWATTDANQGTPVALDVVAVQDIAGLRVLESLSASDWFMSRPAVLANLHGRADAVSREIAPGQRLVIRQLPAGYDQALATVVYANYQSPGEHRAQAPGGARILVDLGRNAFTLSHDNPPGEP